MSHEQQFHEHECSACGNRMCGHQSDAADKYAEYIAAENFRDGGQAAANRILALIRGRQVEWHHRTPDEKPDWHEACEEIADAILRGEHGA